MAAHSFWQMVVLAQQAGGTIPVQVRVVGGSLILTSGTQMATVVVVAAGVQAVRAWRTAGTACPSGVQTMRTGRWARLTPLELS